MTKREIILDTETTGLDPEQGHRVVEIGAVEMVNKVLTGKEYKTYLNPERDMPVEAFRVHNLSAEFLQDKPLFIEEYDKFLAFIQDSPIVAHNARFDIKFLNSELARLTNTDQGNIKLYRINEERVIDTLAIARQKFLRKRVNLTALCNYFGIDIKNRNEAHSAIEDARLLAEVYIELTGGRQEKFAMALKKEKIQDIKFYGEISTNNILVKPSDSELKAHQELLKKIAKCTN